MTYYSNTRVRTLSRKQVQRNGNTLAYERSQMRIGPVSNILLVGFLLTMLGLLYLVQITKTSVYGFEVGELRQSKTELEQQNETLRVEAARLQALNRVEGSELVKDFQQQENLTYLPN